MLLLVISQLLLWQCPVAEPTDRAVSLRDDALARILGQTPQCPEDVFALRTLLQNDGLVLRPTMVANRGRNNPGEGSFSIFETVEGLGEHAGPVAAGMFFFGHFTGAHEDVLFADQEPSAGALLIELIAWDEHPGVFNFYELRGDGRRGAWFYRGNSTDIAADNDNLHRTEPPHFGTRLRCSACHVLGGPIMKELTEPHNDWWRSQRSLPLAERHADESLQEILNELQDANHLASAVRTGVALYFSRAITARRELLETWQQTVRPLFCAMEMNLESDDASAREVKIPSAFLVDGRLTQVRASLNRAAYDAALTQRQMRFPETQAQDADHAFLTPVKAYSDTAWISQLEGAGWISQKFVSDVLAVDARDPIFSSERCALLRYVPRTWTSDWEQKFQNALQASENPVARELAAHMSDALHDNAFYEGVVRDRIVSDLQTFTAVQWLDALSARRAAVENNNISKNPRGQIMEPGFRVIFPRALISGKSSLTR